MGKSSQEPLAFWPARVAPHLDGSLATPIRMDAGGGCQLRPQHCDGKWQLPRPAPSEAVPVLMTNFHRVDPQDSGNA
eukprot:1556865-Pyramimonas_sp.AAC.1